MRLPDDTREWVSFADPAEDRTWMFDVTFLSSGWNCIFGRGCNGVLTEEAPELGLGCCSYGAHFTGEEDAARVEAVAPRLTPAQWQFAGRRASPLRRRTRGPTTTRIVHGACIFLNRPGFAGGTGCTLHVAALADGVAPLVYKPDVCWQLPLRREDEVESSGHVVSRVIQWERRHWGPAGSEFAWWCSEDLAAYGAGEPVVEQMDAELRALCGDAVIELLHEVLRARYGDLSDVPIPRRQTIRSKPTTTPLPHPSLRRTRA